LPFRFAGLFAFLPLGFPSFIWSCGLGGIRTSAPMIRFVSSREFLSMKNPWDIRDASPRGDVDDNMLFMTIGRALTEWEQVEAACATLFAVFVSASQKSVHLAPAIRAYGSIASFKGRHDMLRAAAAAYFHRRKSKKEKFEARLKKLMDECLEYSNRRNEIAHGSVSMLYESRKRSNSMIKIGHYLLPSFYNPKKFKLEPAVTYQYMSSDIIYYQQEFTKLYLRMTALRQLLVGEKPSLPPFPLPGTHAPQ
jgi:hypothetical protein